MTKRTFILVAIATATVAALVMFKMVWAGGHFLETLPLLLAIYVFFGLLVAVQIKLTESRYASLIFLMVVGLFISFCAGEASLGGQHLKRLALVQER